MFAYSAALSILEGDQRVTRPGKSFIAFSCSHFGRSDGIWGVFEGLPPKKHHLSANGCSPKGCEACKWFSYNWAVGLFPLLLYKQYLRSMIIKPGSTRAYQAFRIRSATTFGSLLLFCDATIDCDGLVWKYRIPSEDLLSGETSFFPPACRASNAAWTQTLLFMRF